MLHTNKDQDRRRARRVQVALPVSLLRSGYPYDNEPPISGITTTISTTGIGFTTHDQLKLHAHLQIRMPLPSEEGDRELEAEGTITRALESVHNAGTYEYGMAFTIVENSELLESFIQNINIAPYLRMAVEAGGTSLHLSGGYPPIIRDDEGQLRPLGSKPLSVGMAHRLALGALDTRLRGLLERERETEHLLILPGLGMWKVNTFQQRGSFEAVYSRMPEVFGELPHTAGQWLENRYGLVVAIASDTRYDELIAAIITRMQKGPYRVVMHLCRTAIPIPTGPCIMHQREIHRDFFDMASAIDAAVRQQVDIVIASPADGTGVPQALLRAADGNALVVACFASGALENALGRLLPQNQIQRAMFARLLTGVIIHHPGHIHCVTNTDELREALISGNLDVVAAAAQVPD